MIKIDLKTKKKKDLKKLVDSKLSIFQAFENKEIIVALVGVVILVLGVIYIVFLNFEEKRLISKKDYLQKEKQKLVALERRIKLLKKEVENQKTLKKRLLLRQELLSELLKRKSNIKDVLFSVGKSIPEGIWIENINVSTNSVNLNGYTFNPDNLYLFFRNLKQKYPDLQLSTLGKSKFCRDKNLVLCIEKPKRLKNSNLDFYTFSLNLKNLVEGRKND